MDLETFEKVITSAPDLAEHREFLRGLLRPCVRITITPEKPDGVQSQFGGSPMVPADFQWPEHDTFLYYFLGQINFAEIVDRPDPLPSHGLLSLFYADYDPDSDFGGELFWGNDGYLKVWYFDDLDALVKKKAPHKGKVPGRRITLTGGEYDMPRDHFMREEWPFDFDILDSLIDDPGWPYALRTVRAGDEPDPTFVLATDYLLGYPSYYSLGYNPTPGDDWVALLTLHSHEDMFGWCWQDANKLMVFIERDRLAVGDFSALKWDAG
ncbi:MAG: YwqG family protein [Micrococcales bacterium]|nr:YwqG family protein [Micrococcales bacterium]MCL2668886.1 YwqG family protein [Micrococcales bacterium]